MDFYKKFKILENIELLYKFKVQNINMENIGNLLLQNLKSQWVITN